MEAKHSLAEVFDQIGGLEAAVKWAKNNRSVFYTQLYAKLLPMTLDAKVNVTDNRDETTAKLNSLFSNLVRVHKEEIIAEKAAGIFRDENNIIIDAAANPERYRLAKEIYELAAGIVDNEPQPAPPSAQRLLAYEQPVTRTDSNERDTPAAPRAADPPKPRQLTPAEAKERAKQPSFPQPITAQPTSTSLFYEYYANRGTYWGPVGGGPP